jgi:hypothetical protein
MVAWKKGAVIGGLIGVILTFLIFYTALRGDTVLTESKDAVPAKNISLTPVLPQEQPFELDGETEARIIDLLSMELNTTIGEVEILSVGETYEEGRIAVRTNLGVFTYKEGVIYQTGIHLNPVVDGNEADRIVKELLLHKGIITESTLFYRWDGLILGNLCDLNYERGYDLNFYPTNYICQFYFKQRSNIFGTTYEEWVVGIDSNIGDIIRMKKNREATFHITRTPEESAKKIEKEMSIVINSSKIGIGFDEKPLWIYYGLKDSWIIVTDYGTMEERVKPIPMELGE